MCRNHGTPWKFERKLPNTQILRLHCRKQTNKKLGWDNFKALHPWPPVRKAFKKHHPIRLLLTIMANRFYKICKHTCIFPQIIIFLFFWVYLDVSNNKLTYTSDNERAARPDTLHGLAQAQDTDEAHLTGATGNGLATLLMFKKRNKTCGKTNLQQQTCGKHSNFVTP